MSMPYAIDTSYQPVYLTQANMTAVTNSAPEEDASILTAAQEKKAEKLNVDSACTDGNDNGKIEDGVFGLFLKKTGEGLLKKITAPVTEALKGNFIPAIATVAGIALACNPVTGPFVIAIGTGAAALGVASSAISVGMDIKALNDCANTEGTTDADAKAIVDQMGDHAANGILSLAALIGGVKAMRNKPGAMHDLKVKAANGEKVTLKEQLGAYGQDTLNAGHDVAKAGFGKLTSAGRAITGAQQTQTGVTTSASGQDISGATKLTKTQKSTLTADELKLYQQNRNTYCNPKGGTSSSSTSNTGAAQQQTAPKTNTTDMYIEGANGQMAINLNYPAAQVA